MSAYPVVSDDPRLGMSLHEALTALGHRAFEAVDGRQGLAMASEILPQAALVDWRMAQSDGLELTRSLRQSKAGYGTYVLMVAEEGDEDKNASGFRVWCR